MKNSRLIQILKTFSKEEWKEFDKFVRSPYFNNSEPTIKFFAEIKKFYPDFDNRNLTKEYLFSKVYGKQRFKEDLFRKLVSNLLKLSKQFMTMIVFGRKDVEISKYLRQELLNRGLYELFEIEHTKISALIKGRPIYNEFFMDLSENNLYLGHYYLNKFDNLKHMRAAIDFIKYAALYFFNNAYLITAYYNSKIGFNLADTQNLWELMELIIGNEKIFSAVKKVMPEYSDVLEIENRKYQFSKQPSPDKFYQLKEIVYKLHHGFTGDMKSNFIHFLFNATYIINDNTFNKPKERLELQEFKLKNNLFTARGVFLDVVTFLSFLNQYFRLDRLESAEEFINQYHKKLETSLRKDAYNYGFALVAFHKKDYEKSLMLASKIENGKYPFNLNVKAITILIYIETNNLESAEFAVDTFKKVIKNNAILSENHKAQYNNFTKYAKVIINYPSNEDKRALENAYINIKEVDESQVHSHGYLKTKFEELLA